MAIGVVFITFPIVNIATYKINKDNNWSIEKSTIQFQPEVKQNVEPEKVKDKPDIYYIILDGYGRNDVLKKYYNFDNNYFTLALEKLGFRIFTKSNSNYPQTHLALSSTLNTSYLKLKDKDHKLNEKEYETALAELIKNDPYFVRQLKKLGYRHEHLSSGFYSFQPKGLDKLYYNPRTVNCFENNFLTTTLLFYFPRIMFYFSMQHGKTINYQLDKLPLLVNNNQPTFYFAHIYCPHPPFIFNPVGKIKSNLAFESKYEERINNKQKMEEFRIGNVEQTMYLNKRMLKSVKTLLQNNKKQKPIIIIQGDHGPQMFLERDSQNPNQKTLHERFAILNAIYYPENSKIKDWPENLTPVNTFRYLLNDTFNMNLPILENKYFFSFWNTKKINPPSKLKIPKEKIESHE